MFGWRRDGMKQLGGARPAATRAGPRLQGARPPPPSINKAGAAAATAVAAAAAVEVAVVVVAAAAAVVVLVRARDGCRLPKPVELCSSWQCLWGSLFGHNSSSQNQGKWQ